MPSTSEYWQFAGGLGTSLINLPPGSLQDADIKAGTGIQASKLINRFALEYSQADGSDVVAAIVPIHIARTAGSVLSIEVVCLDAPSGGDKTFTVDLKKCNAGSPTPATILTAPITYPNGTADCTVRAGTIDTAAYADGDTLVVEIAVSGTTGSQGQGLIITVNVDENPN